MSGDQSDLDAFCERVEVIRASGSVRGMWMRLHEADALVDEMRRLRAEVRRLRAQVEQVEALAVAWDEVPDYRRTSYDLGRVDQRHDLALELLTLLAATPPRT